MADEASGQIKQVMQEDRMFPPSESFSSQAIIGSVEQYEELYNRAKDHPNEFWGEIANEEMHWFEPYQSVLNGSGKDVTCLLYTSPSPRDQRGSRMPSSA